MPFTFSHPAAILPLAFLKKKWVSVTGLIFGSITPDFEYFFRMQQNSVYSHTWDGVFWFDLPMGLLIIYLFNAVVRKELIENMPEFLNQRFSKFRYFDRNLYNGKEFLIVLISLLIGILSHLVWDKLTHRSVRLIDEQEHYTVFWEINSLVGAFIITFVILKMPKGNKIQGENIFFYWLFILIITAAVIYIRFLSTSGLRELGISAIVGFFTGLIITSLYKKLNNKTKHLSIQIGRKV